MKRTTAHFASGCIALMPGAVAICCDNPLTVLCGLAWFAAALTFLPGTFWRRFVRASLKIGGAMHLNG